MDLDSISEPDSSVVYNDETDTQEATFDSPEPEVSQFSPPPSLQTTTTASLFRIPSSTTGSLFNQPARGSLFASSNLKPPGLFSSQLPTSNLHSTDTLHKPTSTIQNRLFSDAVKAGGSQSHVGPRPILQTPSSTPNFFQETLFSSNFPAISRAQPKVAIPSDKVGNLFETRVSPVSSSQFPDLEQTETAKSSRNITVEEDVEEGECTSDRELLSPSVVSPIRKSNVLQRRQSRDEIQKRVAIKVLKIPPNYNNRSFLTEHFREYGSITRVFCNTKNQTATIHFSDHESAEKAKRLGSLLGSTVVDILFARYLRPEGSIKSSGVTESSPIFAASPARPKYKKSPSLIKQSVPPAPVTRTGHSLAEKISILEEHDKRGRSLHLRSRELSKAAALHGTCLDMCPEKERYLREDRQRISVYECSADDSRRVDHARVVKEYSRSSADQEEPLPNELRPAPVLERTMFYLLSAIADLGEEREEAGGHWGRWYEFLWSRTRAIRKDIVQQQLCSPQVVEIVEKVARFHVYCAERLCEEDMHSFDATINNENLTKSLQTLREMYQDLANMDDPPFCPNEPEFRAYMILMKLNDASILDDVQKLSPSVRSSPQVKLAMAAYHSLSSCNYVRFFKLTANADYLLACLLHRYFYQVRKSALDIIVSAYTPKTSMLYKFPLTTLVRQLKFENIMAASTFCEHFQLKLDETRNYVVLSRNTRTFETDAQLPVCRAKLLIESKRGHRSVGEVINGGTLPGSLETFLLPSHGSFDAAGKFVGEISGGEGAVILQARNPPSQIQENRVQFFIDADSPPHPIFSYNPQDSDVFKIFEDIYGEVVAKECCDLVTEVYIYAELTEEIFNTALEETLPPLFYATAQEVQTEIICTDAAIEDCAKKLLDAFVIEETRREGVELWLRENEKATNAKALQVLFELVDELTFEEGLREGQTIAHWLAVGEETAASLLNSAVKTLATKIAGEESARRAMTRRYWRAWRTQLHRMLRHLPPRPSMEDDFAVAQSFCGFGAAGDSSLTTALSRKRPRLETKDLQALDTHSTWEPFFKHASNPLPPVTILLPAPPVLAASESRPGKQHNPALLHWLTVKMTEFSVVDFISQLKDWHPVVGRDGSMVRGLLVVDCDDQVYEKVSPRDVCLRLVWSRNADEHPIHPSRLHRLLPIPWNTPNGPCTEWSILVEKGLVWLVDTLTARRNQLLADAALTKTPSDVLVLGELVETVLQCQFYRPVADDWQHRTKKGLLHQKPNILLKVYLKAVDRLSTLLSSTNCCPTLPPGSLDELQLPLFRSTSEDNTWSIARSDLIGWLSEVKVTGQGQERCMQLVARACRKFQERAGSRPVLPLYENMPWTELVLAVVDDRLINSRLLTDSGGLSVVPERMDNEEEWTKTDWIVSEDNNDPTYQKTLELALQQERNSHLLSVSVPKYESAVVRRTKLDLDSLDEKLSNLQQSLRDCEQSMSEYVSQV